MNRRTRLLSALLALAAMTFSLAESVVASTCAPMSMMDAMPAAPAPIVNDTGAATPASEAAPGAMDCPFMTTQEGDDGRDGPHCPFGPALGQGCAGPPSLPAVTLDVSPAPADPASGVSIDETQPHLLLARALFHPPRA